MRDTADLNGDKYKKEGTVTSQCNQKYDRLSLRREDTGYFFQRGGVVRSTLSRPIKVINRSMKCCVRLELHRSKITLNNQELYLELYYSNNITKQTRAISTKELLTSSACSRILCRHADDAMKSLKCMS